MNRYAEIIIDIAYNKLDRPFTYRVPERMQPLVQPGSLVLVPFGKGNTMRKGYIIALISGATSMSIDNRMKALGVTQCYTGCANKMERYTRFLAENGLEERQVVCMGDDIPDYGIMTHCGVAACPADAAIEIKEISDYVSLYQRGKGCVRDIIEQVLRLQGNWFDPQDSQHEALKW